MQSAMHTCWPESVVLKKDGSQNAVVMTFNLADPRNAPIRNEDGLNAGMAVYLLEYDSIKSYRAEYVGSTLALYIHYTYITLDFMEN